MNHKLFYAVLRFLSSRLEDPKRGLGKLVGSIVLLKTMAILACLLNGMPSVMASVRSSTNVIHFSTSDQQQAMTLTTTGLGIGVTPSSNLHVSGNTLVSTSLSVGSLGNASANLSISGTFGVSPLLTTSNTTIVSNSMVLADTSSSNIDVTLPYAGNVQGRKINVKKISQSNELWVLGGGNMIDNVSSLKLSGSITSCELISDGQQWYLLNGASNICFKPTLTSNCVLWLDAMDAGSITKTGNATTQWSDKSGRGNHAVQNTGSKMPIYTTNGFNGMLPSLHFISGNAMNMAVSDATGDFDVGTGGFSFYAVVTLKNLSSWNIILSKRQFDDDFEFRFLATSGALEAFIDNSNSPTGASLSIDTPYQTNMIRQSGGAISMRVNQASYTSSTLSGSISNAHDLLIGTRGDGSSLPFDGHISELIFFNKALTSEESNSIEKYLQHKWQL